MEWNKPYRGQVLGWLLRGSFKAKVWLWNRPGRDVMRFLQKSFLTLRILLDKDGG
jgi:hypothetical protein